MAHPRLPLKFKMKSQEIVFRRDSVRDVAIIQSKQGGDRWTVQVNGYQCFAGSESAARKHYERALRYI